MIDWSPYLRFFLASFFVATVAHAQDRSDSPKTKEATSKPRNDSLAKWLGAYEPLSRACEKEILTMGRANLTWGDCKRAKTQLISVSKTELVVSVDPKANCGWAGWIVALTTPSADSRAVSVNAYRARADYQAKNSKSFCAYSKSSLTVS